METTTKTTMTIRRAAQRGVSDHGWLDSRHSFSFAGYYDPEHMGFHSLRVINDDRVAPAKGFGTHPHENMEIISYVVDGQLEHKDSLGNGSIIHPGDVQRMSAGTGVQHSEFNPDPNQPVHFLQIWIQPAEMNTPPSYEQKHFTQEEKHNQLRLVVSPDGVGGSVSIGQAAYMYATLLDASHKIYYKTDPQKHIWVQIVQGKVDLNGEVLSTGDGAALEATHELNLTGLENSEVLVFELG